MNKNIIIIVVVLGIIAGAAYWYYYQAPTQTAVEETVSSVPESRIGFSGSVESDTSAVIDQDIQNIDINGSGTDFQEIDNSLNNL